VAKKTQNGGIGLLRRLLSWFGAGVLTLATFLVLPLMQTIAHPERRDMIVRNLGFANLPPPPPPPEQQLPPEEPPEPPPPQLTEAPQPLDLSQLELALNPGLGEGAFGDFTVKLFEQIATEGEGEDIDRIFSLAELDQRPRVIFQRMPSYPQELRRSRRNGTVYIVFLVNQQGRVVNAKVEKSSDPAFEQPALEAVRQWKFEPGTRNGEKVQFKMRVPITFNAG
jgi:protein TonB